MDAYTLIEKVHKYKDFDYREAFRELYIAHESSKYWEEVRKAVRKRDNNTCRDCGETEKTLIVHHTDYDMWGIGGSREVEACILVCKKCHNKRHHNGSVKTPFWATRNGEPNRQEEEATRKAFKDFEI